MLHEIKKLFDKVIEDNNENYHILPLNIFLKLSGPITGLVLTLSIFILHRFHILLPDIHALYLIIVVYSIFTSNIYLSIFTACLGAVYYINIAYFSETIPYYNEYSYITKIFNILELFLVVIFVEYVKKLYLNKSIELNNRINDIQNTKMALQLSENRLKTITDNMTDIILQTNYYGIYQYVSPSCESITGFKPEELIGKSYFERIHPDDISSLKRIAKNAIKNNSSHTIFYRYIRKDGTTIWMETSGKPIFDTKGKAIGAVFCAREITDRLRTQIALQESEEKFRELFNHANDAIFLYEFSDYGCFGKIIEVNDIACKEYEYSREEFLKMSTFDINYNKYLQLTKEEMNTFTASGNLTYERLLVSKSGNIIPAEISSHVFELNGNKVVLAIIRNISDRRQAEHALMHSQDLLGKIIKYIPSYLIVTDTNFKIRMCNKVFEEAAGAPSNEIISSYIFDIFPQPYEKIYVDRLNAVVETGAPLILNDCPLYKCSSKSKPGYFNIRVSSLNNSDGKVEGLIITLDDNSALHESEERNRILFEALEYDRLRTEFFANISHEFRTPLNVILATIQLVEKMYVHQESVSSKYLSILKQNCYRLLRLVNNLIDITRIDSGFYELHLKNCNIISLVEDITLSVANYIENKGIELTFDTNTEELTLACDPDKIERIILNLLSNAVKFTKPGGQITVNIEDLGEKLTILISDTGIGIPEDMAAAIFERFRQVNKSMTRECEGSGIGLSLVKSLVELHGGNISLKSCLGKGSSFLIELPVKVLENEEISLEIPKFNQNQTIERINIEFSDIYQSKYQIS